MEEDDEEMLRDEVIYLHSLWHKGPPPPLQPPQHHHHPPPPQPPQPHRLLNPPLFKKQRPSKRPKQSEGERSRNSVEISTSEWPCPPSPPPKSPSRPSFKPTQLPSNAHVQLSSPKLQSWAAGKVVKEVAKFFKTKINASDNDDDDEEMEDDDSEDEEGGENGDYFGFFLNLFEESEDLMSFYENNYEDGEFGCLVCEGVGVRRRFKDCVALVQHTQSISETKTLKAHRAFGQVVCIVLGWDVNKLPSFTSSISEKKYETLSKLEEDQPRMQEKVTNEAVDVGSGDKEAEGAEQLLDNCELAVAENLQSVPGVGGYANDQIKEIQNEKQENAESASNCLNLQSVPGVAGYANDQIKEIQNEKQENAESASDCFERRNLIKKEW